MIGGGYIIAIGQVPGATGSVWGQNPYCVLRFNTRLDSLFVALVLCTKGMHSNGGRRDVEPLRD